MTKFLIDFFPVLAFFITYKTMGIYWATAVLMAASVLQTLVSYALTKKWQAMHLYVLGFSLFFGSLTLLLHDDRMIKLKVTVVFWFIAAIFLVRQYWLKKYTVRDLLQGVSSETINAPDALWARLNLLWAAIKFGIGLLNLYIAFVLSVDNNDLWVNFKVWGVMAIEFALIIYTFSVLAKYFPQTEQKPS